MGPDPAPRHTVTATIFRFAGGRNPPASPIFRDPERVPLPSSPTDNEPRPYFPASHGPLGFSPERRCPRVWLQLRAFAVVHGPLAKIVERLHESVTAISECKELGPTGRERPNSHPQLPAIRTSEFHPKEVEEIPSPNCQNCG